MPGRRRPWQRMLRRHMHRGCRGEQEVEKLKADADRFGRVVLASCEQPVSVVVSKVSPVSKPTARSLMWESRKRYVPAIEVIQRMKHTGLRISHRQEV